MDRAERFARAAALANDIPPPRAPLGMVLRFAVALALLVYGILWVLRHLHLPELLREMAGWLVLWLGIMGIASRTQWKRLRAPFVRTAVLIVKKRVIEDATIVLHYIVVEDEHGHRVEHLVTARVYDAAQVGAIGVLFTKQDVAWGFHPVTATYSA